MPRRTSTSSSPDRRKPPRSTTSSSPQPTYTPIRRLASGLQMTDRCGGSIGKRSPRTGPGASMANFESDAFVFFGATGDLAFRQVFPALQSLIRRNAFNGPIVGVARSAATVDALRERARASLEAHGGIDPEAFAKLSERLRYVNGDYQDQTTYLRLRTAL